MFSGRLELGAFAAGFVVARGLTVTGKWVRPLQFVVVHSMSRAAWCRVYVAARVGSGAEKSCKVRFLWKVSFIMRSF